MPMSNIVVASAEQIAENYGLELADSHSKTPNGNYCPYGLAAIVTDHRQFADVVISASDVVCPDCASEEELRDDNDVGTAVFGNDEWDSPATCMDCGKVLRVRQLVYESHDPELFDKLSE